MKLVPASSSVTSIGQSWNDSDFSKLDAKCVKCNVIV